MSIETLKSDVQNKTKEAVSRILKEVKKEAEKIVEDGKRKTDEIKAKLSEKLKRELEEKASMEGAIEEAEGRKRIANLKQEFIDKVFKDADAGLRKLMKEDDYKKLLPELAAEAVSALGGDNLILMVNEDDKKLMKNALNNLQRRLSGQVAGEAVFKLDDETIECIGGVVVFTKDRGKSFNNTIDARLSRLRTETWQIAQILFGGDS